MLDADTIDETETETVASDPTDEETDMMGLLEGLAKATGRAVDQMGAASDFAQRRTALELAIAAAEDVTDSLAYADIVAGAKTFLSFLTGEDQPLN